MQLLLDRYFPHMKPGEDYREIIPEELNITAVYSLDVEQWSGKEDLSPPDFPGAFNFPYQRLWLRQIWIYGQNLHLTSAILPPSRCAPPGV